MSFGVRILGALFGLIILAAPVGAGAAELPVLDYKQLVVKALEFSPEVKASKSEVRYAQGKQEEVKGYYFPQMDVYAFGGLTPNARAPYQKDGQLYFPDPANRIHGINVFGRVEFMIVQPLYTFGKIAHRDKAVGKYVKVKEAGVEAKKGEVILRIAEAYYGLILANQGRDAVKEARTYLNDTKVRIDRLLRIGSPSVQESDRYRLAMYEGGVDKFGAQAEEGAKVAYQALKALIGYGPGQDFQVPTDLPNPAQAPHPLSHYIQESLDLRPEFTQLKEGLVARQLLVDAARADQYPSLFAAVVGAFAGAPGRAPVAGNQRDPAIMDYYNQQGVGPIVGVSWHWDFGILKAKVKQAQAELEQLKHTERTALMGIPVEVAQYYHKVQENYKGSLGMEKAYVNARRWLITAFSNFDMGLGKMEDIFQAFERYGSFRGDYLLALYQYNLATAQLDRATGAYRRTLPAEAPVVPVVNPSLP